MIEHAEYATYEALTKIATKGGGRPFVWPEEGAFSEKGKWSFNEEHEEFEPLWVDPTTASLLVKVHDALNEVNAVRFAARLGESRGWFGGLVEHAWGRVKCPR